MSFEDIPVRNYKDYISIIEKCKPYRSADHNNRYPLGYREYSRRYFTINPETGSVVTFYDNYELATIHKDNTIEFTAYGGYGQGEKGVVERLTHGLLQTQSNYGGTVYYNTKKWYERKNALTHPVFKGLRFNIATGELHESSIYELHTLSIDTKKAAPIRKKYGEFFDIGAKLVGVMDKHQIYEEMISVRRQLQTKGWSETDAITDRVDEYLVNSDGAGALIYLGAVFNYRELDWLSKWGSADPRSLATFGEKVFVEYVKRNFFDRVYTQQIDLGHDICKTRITRVGDKLPTVRWGQKVFVGGKEASRYR